MKQRQSSVSRGDIRSRAFIFSIYVFLPVSVSVYLVFLACFFFQSFRLGWVWDHGVSCAGFGWLVGWLPIWFGGLHFALLVC
jgi:hypothetical protein